MKRRKGKRRLPLSPRLRPSGVTAQRAARAVAALGGQTLEGACEVLPPAVVHTRDAQARAVLGEEEEVFDLRARSRAVEAYLARRAGYRMHAPLIDDLLGVVGVARDEGAVLPEVEEEAGRRRRLALADLLPAVEERLYVAGESLEGLRALARRVRVAERVAVGAQCVVEGLLRLAVGLHDELRGREAEQAPLREDPVLRGADAEVPAA